MSRETIPKPGDPDLTKAERRAFTTSEGRDSVDRARDDVQTQMNEEKIREQGWKPVERIDQKLARLKIEFPEAYGCLMSLKSNSDLNSMPPGWREILLSEGLVKRIGEYYELALGVGDYIFKRPWEGLRP